MKKYLFLLAVVLTLTSCNYPKANGDISETQSNNSLGYGKLEIKNHNVIYGNDNFWTYGEFEVKSHSEVYDYENLTEAGQQAFDLMYGEYFSGEVIRGEKSTNSFKLAKPIPYAEYQNVISLYKAATRRYSRPCFRYDTNHLNMVESVYAGGIISDSEIDLQFFESQEKAAEIISEMPPDLNEIEKCRYIASYLADNVVYHTEERPYTSSDSDVGYIPYETDYGIYNVRVPLPNFIMPYGALINGEANCEGYARAFAALAYEAGVNCIVVEGDAPNGRHAWNMVETDGHWYHIDPCWIDNGDGFDENYFMVNDEQISKTHKAVKYAGNGFVSPPLSE